MAAGRPSGTNSDIKTQFSTKEGVYRLLQQSVSQQYSKPTRIPNNVPVRLSFSTVKDGTSCEDKIAFNIGKDMYCYNFRGVKKATDTNLPIDRRAYKGPQPTCHDVNAMTRQPDSLEVLVGFNGGQVQLMDPLKHECMKCFNEERGIEKTAVTCIQWLPGSDNVFLVSHLSGSLYVYDKELPAMEPQYVLLSKGNHFKVDSVKDQNSGNPILRWTIGCGAINEFSFSPDCKHLAVVSHDGYLRVFDYDKREMVGAMRSYFGGILCVTWSPDGKYILTGGEDDLVTVWSFHEQRVVARGEGHRSWVNVVAFDPYTTHTGLETIVENGNSVDNGETSSKQCQIDPSRDIQPGRTDFSKLISYRFGSVGDDTQLLLWELSEDVLHPQKNRTRSIRGQSISGSNIAGSNNSSTIIKPAWSYAAHSKPSDPTTDTLNANDESQPSTNLSSKSNSFSKRTSKHQNSVSHFTPTENENLSLGSHLCPRMNEIPKLEPLVAKKIADDRLSSLVFREDCVVTACFEGYVHVWARPQFLEPSTIIN